MTLDLDDKRLDRIERLIEDAAEDAGDDLPDGPDRYLAWIDGHLDIELTALQRAIGEAVGEHRKVLVIGGNGPGKTYAVVAVTLAFLFGHADAKVLATSGTYGKLRRTFCRPLERLHRDAQRDHGLGGVYKKSPPRVEFPTQPERFFEATRPVYAGELEGTHAPHLLSIVDEADKPGVDEDVMDSMASLLTDERDRQIVIANPPRDRANVVADLLDDDTFHTVHVSAFDSRNVRAAVGEVDADPIDGLITLGELQSNWESWNREPWPGADVAATAHEQRDDLDTRWYRRRAGVIPPDGAAVYRPIRLEDVEAAFERDTPGGGLQGLGIDVARAGGDYTVVAARHGDRLAIEGRWTGTDHNENETRLRGVLEDYNKPPGAIDAQGEGSALADRLIRDHRSIERFASGAKPMARREYRDCWAEGLHALGRFLADGGSIDDPTLREELDVAARTIEFTERHLDSRGSRGATVLECTGKDAVTERLGRSPDCLDAAMMAVWKSERGRGSMSVYDMDFYIGERQRY